jgi:hypothetical protein
MVAAERTIISPSAKPGPDLRSRPRLRCRRPRQSDRKSPPGFPRSASSLRSVRLQWFTGRSPKSGNAKSNNRFVVKRCVRAAVSTQPKAAFTAKHFNFGRRNICRRRGPPTDARPKNRHPSRTPVSDEFGLLGGLEGRLRGLYRPLGIAPLQQLCPRVGADRHRNKQRG